MPEEWSQAFVTKEYEGQFSVANPPSLHIFGLWGRNPRKHGENVQTPHGQSTDGAHCGSSLVRRGTRHGDGVGGTLNDPGYTELNVTKIDASIVKPKLLRMTDSLREK
ncbi:hypothetical protein scyTo_0006269 [Scyliorhinus torazame]|uniref:Uncharacterized protein n=1 Tax=Scyliorhinus torazame TaxID=75743 RepID=A0A401PGV7_SCYTO|nr:hypothetical protein [Scyliorhinus torazame]